MGTKAVFAIAATRAGCINNPILGMLSDGFPGNLLLLAREFLHLSKKEKKYTKIRQLQPTAVQCILQKLECLSNGNIFLDDIKNAEWVSYSCIFNPKNNTIKLFRGKFDDLIGYYHLSDIPFSYLLRLPL